MTDESKEQKLSLIWRGINIEISYNPSWMASYAHLQIQSENNKRLPMTETGYRSHFTLAANIEEYGSPIDFVKAWLEHDAKSKEWKAYGIESKQLKLF